VLRHGAAGELDDVERRPGGAEGAHEDGVHLDGGLEHDVHVGFGARGEAHGPEQDGRADRALDRRNGLLRERARAGVRGVGLVTARAGVSLGRRALARAHRDSRLEGGPGGDADREVGRRDAEPLREFVRPRQDGARAPARGGQRRPLPHEVGQQRRPAGEELRDPRGMSGGQVDRSPAELRDVRERALSAELEKPADPGVDGLVDPLLALARPSRRGRRKQRRRRRICIARSLRRGGTRDGGLGGGVTAFG
jgi:hypothetical protein